MTDKELLSNVQKIQDLMIRVSTGAFFDEITDKEYKELYFKIKIALRARSIRNNNNFSSLVEFYKYWSEKLPTYKDRRYYIHNLYKQAEDNLYLSISAVETNSNNYSISFDDLNEEIVFKCKEDFINEKYDECATNALKLLEIKVREKGGFDDTYYGKHLMHSAFILPSLPFRSQGLEVK